MSGFAQAFLNKAPKQLEASFPSLGLSGTFHALSPEELYETMEMGGFRGIKYGLYLACPQLFEAGTQLFTQGKVHSPEDVCNLLSPYDIDLLWRGVLDISADREQVILTESGATYTPSQNGISAFPFLEQEPMSKEALLGDFAVDGATTSAFVGDFTAGIGQMDAPTQSSGTEVGQPRGTRKATAAQAATQADPDRIATHIVTRLLALADSM